MATIPHTGPVRRHSFVLLIACLAAVSARADDTGFLSRVHVDDTGDHHYSVYVPPDYHTQAAWPVVLYLHGAGVGGHDGQQHLSDGLAAVIRAEGDFDAIVVFPQCEELDAPLLSRWAADAPDGRRALRILDEVRSEFAIDPQRQILTGWSMGGYGAWNLAAADPDRWAAVVPVSGGGNVELATRITAPVWAIHGASDRAIPSEPSQLLVDAVTRAGGQATMTSLADVGHDAWRYAYSSPTVRRWMLSGGQAVAEPAALEREAAAFAASGGADALDGEFRPALVIPRAVSVRIGNDALETLACGVPDAVDPELLAGPIDDLRFEFSAAGETFAITQEQVRFHAQLNRILVEATAEGHVRIRIGLQPLSIVIGATHVRGAAHSADAGPFEIRLGHRYPVWVDVRLRPTVRDGRLRFSVVRSEFQIPDANWLVTTPQELTVSGPGLTEELARVALVGGIYTRRHEIEKCVRDVLPGLVNRLEERLQPRSLDHIVANVWPMPVFRPRLRLQPEEVAVDRDGLTLVMGLSAASLRSAQKPREPIIAAARGPHAAEVPASRNLVFGIAPQVLQELSGLVVRANAARIDVRDMPEPEFRLLGDRRELNRILPQLEQLGDAVEVRTELDLAEPFVVERAEPAELLQFTAAVCEQLSGLRPAVVATPTEQAADEIDAHFEIPRLIVTVLIRERAAATGWQPFATFDVRLMHSAAVRLIAADHQRRTAQLAWTGAPDLVVKGGYVGPQARQNAVIDETRLGELVRNCWLAWTGDAAVEEDIPDLVLGSAHLRIDGISWRGPELVARYQTPETWIRNSGHRLVEYAVRRPLSNWGPRRQLKPGDFDVYESSSALIVRRFPSPVESAITVPVGGEIDLAAGD